MSTRYLRPALAMMAVASSAVPAFAHHPMGGQTPATFMEGLLSGIGHPIIGLDHLAFVIAMGVAAVLAGSRFLAPLAFILAAIAGTAIHVAGIGLPAVEFMVALSVAAIGLMIMSGRAIPATAYAAVFAIAGLFHGHAYGEAVFGAETTPILAYLAGFAAVQYVIALAAGYVVVDVIGRGIRSMDNMAARMTGGMVAGAGGLMIGQHALTAIGLG